MEADRRGVYVRQLMTGDIDYVAANMREADREEIYAACGSRDAREALIQSVILSSECYASVARNDEKPVDIFGVVPVSLLEGRGRPWMLGTDRVSEFPSTLVKDARRYVRRMLAVYSHLENHVDARNTASVRWLARLGFTIHPATPFGPFGMPFHRFEKRA